MKDLFDISISASDKNYIALRDDSKYTHLKEYCMNLWNKYSPYADRSFCDEFAHQLHPRFWEMYLANYLIDYGIELIPRKMEKGPDIQCKINNSSIWIEATVAEEGKGPDAVPNIFSQNRNESIPQEKIILRFTNAISNKKKLYDEYLQSGIVRRNDNYVIALNGGDIGMVSFDPDPVPAIVKSVYPMGDSTFILNTETSDIVDHYFQWRPYVNKKSGSSVPITFPPAISGIIYSDVALWNHSSVDLIFVHNRDALNPLERGWLNFKEEYWFEGNRFYFSK